MNAFQDTLAAIENGDLKLVKRLLNQQPYLLHFQDPLGWPVPHRCLRDPVSPPCFDLDLAKLLFECGGDLNRRTDSGHSLLFLAAINYKGREIADYLAARGARMSRYEEVVLAMVRGRNTMQARAKLKLLLSKEPHVVNWPGPGGMTLLHHAARESKAPLVRMLLDHGADPNALASDGSSPLGYCSALACRKLLLQKGARPTAREQIGQLLYDGDDSGAIRIFEAEPRLVNAWYPLKSMSFLHLAVWIAKTARTVIYLLEHGADTNTRDEDDRTALHRLMFRSSMFERPGGVTEEMFRVLVRHGVEVDGRDFSGCTPLHLAVAHNNSGIARLLVETTKVDVNAQTEDGQTPLDVVYEQNYIDAPEVAKYLKSKGARRGKRG